MPSSTTLFSSNRKVHRPRPFGGSEHANAINLASFSPSKIGVTEGFEGFLRLRTASKPSSTSCWRARYTVVALVSSASTIRLSLQPSPPSETSAFNRIRAFISFCAELFPLWIMSSSRLRSSWLNRTTYFFTAISLADMVAPIAVPCDKGNQPILSNPLKRATRRHRQPPSLGRAGHLLQPRAEIGPPRV